MPADLLAAIDKHKDEPRKRVILRSAIKAAVLYDEASGVDSSDWSTLGVHAIEWVVASLREAGVDEERIAKLLKLKDGFAQGDFSRTPFFGG